MFPSHNLKTRSRTCVYINICPLLLQLEQIFKLFSFLRDTLCKHVIPVSKCILHIVARMFLHNAERKKWIGKIQRAEGILIRMRLRYSRAKEFVLLIIDVLVISVIFRTSVQTLPVRKCLKYEWKITFFLPVSVYFSCLLWRLQFIIYEHHRNQFISLFYGIIVILTECL